MPCEDQRFFVGRFAGRDLCTFAAASCDTDFPNEYNMMSFLMPEHGMRGHQGGMLKLARSVKV
jgi:hypothetical protein